MIASQNIMAQRLAGAGALPQPPVQPQPIAQPMPMPVRGTMMRPQIPMGAPAQGRPMLPMQPAPQLPAAAPIAVPQNAMMQRFRGAAY